MRTCVTEILRARLESARGDLFTPSQAGEILGYSLTKTLSEIRLGWLGATDVNAGCGKAGRRPLWRVSRADVLRHIERIERGA